MLRPIVLAVALILGANLALAAGMAPRDGWVVQTTPKSFEALVDAVRTAAKSNGMGVVTQAGPTGAAKARGIEIPGNRIIGVFNNDFAVRTLNLSTPAMIEAPIRFYVTENKDGTATLSYKTPSFVFAPYVGEAGTELEAIGTELDTIFAAIASDAVQ